MTLTTPQPNGHKLLPPSFVEREERAANRLQDEFDEYLDPDGHDDPARAVDAYYAWRQVRAERAVAAFREWFATDPHGRELWHVSTQ